MSASSCQYYLAPHRLSWKRIENGNPSSFEPISYISHIPSCDGVMVCIFLQCHHIKMHNIKIRHHSISKKDSFVKWKEVLCVATGYRSVHPINFFPLSYLNFAFGFTELILTFERLYSRNWIQQKKILSVFLYFKTLLSVSRKTLEAHFRQMISFAPKEVFSLHVWNVKKSLVVTGCK